MIEHDKEKVGVPQSLCQVIMLHEVLLIALENRLEVALTEEEHHRCYHAAEVVCWILGHDDEPSELGYGFRMFVRTLMDKLLAGRMKRMTDAEREELEERARKEALDWITPNVPRGREN